MYLSSHKQCMRGHLLKLSYLDYLASNDKSSIVIISVDADEGDIRNHLLNLNSAEVRNLQYLW